jgi:hypothetical protein
VLSNKSLELLKVYFFTALGALCEALVQTSVLMGDENSKLLDSTGFPVGGTVALGDSLEVRQGDVARLKGIQEFEEAV